MSLVKLESPEMPGHPAAEHGVEDGEELAHACDEGDLGRLACGLEPLVERSNGGVPASAGERCHVKHGAYGGSPTPDGATAAEGPAVAIEGCDADEGSDLFAAEGAELR